MADFGFRHLADSPTHRTQHAPRRGLLLLRVRDGNLSNIVVRLVDGDALARLTQPSDGLSRCIGVEIGEME